KKDYVIDVTNGKNDTLFPDSHSLQYTTIKIRHNNGVNEYTFRYEGDEEYWKKSSSSSIFIAYAFNQNRRGGSQGNGGVTWYTPFLKSELTSVFKAALIEKVDKHLGVK